MKTATLILAVAVAGCGLVGRKAPAPTAAMIPSENLEWQLIAPDLGAKSPKMAILRVDPKTGATQALIWHPAGFHVPRHWHTANESGTVVEGTFRVDCDGRQETLGPGSYFFFPAKHVHQGWAGRKKPLVTAVFLDGPWDVNWVDGPPGPPQPGEKPKSRRVE